VDDEAQPPPAQESNNDNDDTPEGQVRVNYYRVTKISNEDRSFIEVARYGPYGFNHTPFLAAKANRKYDKQEGREVAIVAM
jgi:hypothetical protein